MMDPPSACTAFFATSTFALWARKSARSSSHVPPSARMTEAVEAASSASSGSKVRARQREPGEN